MTKMLPRQDRTVGSSAPEVDLTHLTPWTSLPSLLIWPLSRIRTTTVILIARPHWASYCTDLSLCQLLLGLTPPLSRGSGALKDTPGRWGPTWSWPQWGSEERKWITERTAIPPFPSLSVLSDTIDIGPWIPVLWMPWLFSLSCSWSTIASFSPPREEWEAGSEAWVKRWHVNV